MAKVFFCAKACGSFVNQTVIA